MPRVKLPPSGPCLLIVVLLFTSVGSAQTATILRGTNVRKTPNTTSAILETLHQGDSVTLRSTRKRTGYYHVTASDGTVGWVLAKNVSTSATSPGSGLKAGNKIGIACPAAIAGTEATITDCPDTGCGPSLDPNLNKQKNIATDNDAPVDKDFSFLAALPDPVPDFAIGDTREKLITLGEGQMIRVVALALKARVGGKESCNCGLAKPADTDNHIVLVDPSVTNPTLAKDETTSQTAEFAPRVRLTHAKLVGMDLQALIAATPNQALLVRVTGVQMFDSEHSLGPFHLKRKNNWEIHPVFGLEYCPTDKKCTQESDANWVDMEK